jgi:transcriptional regulator of acetoin/glycerol metabolism
MTEDEIIRPEHLPANIQGRKVSIDLATPKTSTDLKKLKKQIKAEAVGKVEQAFLLDLLNRNDWNISQSAREAGMQRQNFQALMRKHGVKRGR